MDGGEWLRIFNPSIQTDIIREETPFQSRSKFFDFAQRLLTKVIKQRG